VLSTNLEDVVLDTGDALGEEQDSNEGDASEGGGGEATIRPAGQQCDGPGAGSRRRGIRRHQALERQAGNVGLRPHPGESCQHTQSRYRRRRAVEGGRDGLTWDRREKCSQPTGSLVSGRRGAWRGLRPLRAMCELVICSSVERRVSMQRRGGGGSGSLGERELRGQSRWEESRAKNDSGFHRPLWRGRRSRGSNATIAQRHRLGSSN